MSQPTQVRASGSAVGQDLPEPSHAELFVQRILSSSRYFMLLAVVGSFLSACGALVFAWLTGIGLFIQEIALHQFDLYGIKRVSVELISLVDLFLIGTVLYIISVGIYQLFISPSLKMPNWLNIDDLDDLKQRLLSTVSVLLSVSFLGYLVTWDGTGGLVGIGIGVGVVLLALSLLLRGFREDDHHPPSASRAARLDDV
jgi:uncharacterized membrane protein YqhA